MVTTPYQRGRSREYQVLRMLREQGWYCSRSAMSHGPVDIFAARKGKVVLIQVKSGNGRMSRSDVEEFVSWAKGFDAQGELWVYRKGGKLMRKLLHTPRNDRARSGFAVSRPRGGNAGAGISRKIN